MRKSLGAVVGGIAQGMGIRKKTLGKNETHKTKNVSAKITRK